jgi:hypothetical protein
MTTTTKCHECGAPTKGTRQFCRDCQRARDESTARLLRQFSPEANRAAMATPRDPRSGRSPVPWIGGAVIVGALILSGLVINSCHGDDPCYANPDQSQCLDEHGVPRP